MPEAELIFRARTEGSVATEVGRVNQALQQVKQNAAQLAAGNPYAVATGQIRKMSDEGKKGAEVVEMHALSIRHMKGAVNTLTEALGSQNSALATAGGHIAMFQRMVSGLPAGMGAAAVGILAVGAAVITHLNILEEARQRYAEIARDLAENNSAGLRGKMRDQSASMSQVESEGFWSIGTLQDLGRKMLFAPTRWEEATEKAEDYRKALDKLLPAEKRIADAQFAQRRGELTLSGWEQYAGMKAASGALRQADIDIINKQEMAALNASIDAAKTVAKEKAKQEVNVANARQASDAELNLIADKHQKDLYVIEETGAQKRIDLEQKNLEKRRALARQEMAEQESILKDRLSRRQAAAEIAASVDTAIRHAGDTTYLGSMDAGQRARMGLSTEYAGTAADLAATQAASAARVAEIGRTQTQIKAAMEGYLAQNLMSEREYADKVRGMDQELTQAKMQGLQQYAQALTTALGKAASDYAKYADEVRGLEKSIRATKQDTADAVAAIKQAGMTPIEAAADREKRATEALTAAMQLSGQEQVDALKKVQAEYTSLGVAAMQAAKEQKDAAKQATDSFTLAGDAWRTSPGQHSEAYNKAWNSPSSGGPNSIGNNSGTAAPAFMNTAAPAYMDSLSAMPFGITRAQIAAREAERTALENVKKTADLIVTAEERQLQAAKDNATQAERMVGSLTTAANEAARLAEALANAKPSSPTAPGDKWTAEKKQAMQQAANNLVDEIRGGSGGNADAPRVTGLSDYEAAVIQAQADAWGAPTKSDQVDALVNWATHGAAEPSVLADGGIVRRTGMALVHQGEVVMNKGQQRQMGNQYSFSIVVQGGGNVSDLDRATVRRLVREEIIPEIERVQDAS